MGLIISPKTDLPSKKAISLARNLRRRRIYESRKRFLPFVLSTFPEYRLNWHHSLICDYLEAFYELKIPRLLISMPPRMGKSELVSRRFPAWILGKNPDTRIITASYNSRLSTDNSRMVKRIIDDPRYQEIFPDTRLGKAVVTNSKESAKNTSDQWEIVGHKGSFLATSVVGSVTGFGAKYILLDDLVKGRKAAESKTQMDDVWSWLQDDLLTRGEEPFGILLAATRWGLDDPTGRFLRENPYEWEVLELPAVKEDDTNDLDPREIGEPLWPEWFAGLNTAEEDMPPREELVEKALKKYHYIQIKNPYGYATLQQQRPIPKEGNIIKYAWTKQRYRVLPDVPGEWLQSWDAKAGSKDPRSSLVSGQVWFRPYQNRIHTEGSGSLVKGGRFYLVDRVSGRWGIKETMDQIRLLSSKWPMAITKLLEAKADGSAIKELLLQEVPGIVAVTPKGGKENRCEAVSAYWQAGNVWLPDKSIAPWIDEVVSIITDFPSGTTDDDVDSMTQALLYWTGGGASNVWWT